MTFLRNSRGSTWTLLAALAGTLVLLSPTAFGQGGPPPPFLDNLVVESGNDTIGWSSTGVTIDPSPTQSNLHSVFTYDVNIPNNHTNFRIAVASSNDPFFSLYYDIVTPNTPSLDEGETVQYFISIEEFFVPVTTYQLNVTRLGGPSNAFLSSLALSEGNLAPGFSPTTFTYSSTVPNETASLTVTLSAQNPASTITVEGTPVTSGATSGPIALAVGLNVIDIVSTSEDTSSVRNYTVNVVREAPDPDTDDDGMFDVWELANGLNVGVDDSSGDLDLDGMLNLQEYAFGSAANDPDDHDWPVIGSNGNGFLTIRFNRAVTDGSLTYNVLVCSEFDNWTTAVTHTNPGGGNPEIWRDSGSPNPLPARFMRVGVTPAP